jgi:Uma2 family endonuclease
VNDLLEPIMQSPKFPEFTRTLNEAWEAEQRQRAVFLEELTPSMKAEFISGKMVTHSPARARHLNATAELLGAFRGFAKKNNGKAYSEKCLVSLTRNDYEPDIVYFAPAKAVKIEPTQMRFPAPDLVVEVLSESTEARDRGVKFRDYAAHGVSEYWIVDTAVRTVEQYVLPGGEENYVLHEKLAHGSVRSVAIEGFELELDRIFTA